jgi:cell shape-determining protein MreC
MEIDSSDEAEELKEEMAEIDEKLREIEELNSRNYHIDD